VVIVQITLRFLAKSDCVSNNTHLYLHNISMLSETQRVDKELDEINCLEMKPHKNI